ANAATASSSSRGSSASEAARTACQADDRSDPLGRPLHKPLERPLRRTTDAGDPAGELARVGNGADDLDLGDLAVGLLEVDGLAGAMAQQGGAERRFGGVDLDVGVVLGHLAGPHHEPPLILTPAAIAAH